MDELARQVGNLFVAAVILDRQIKRQHRVKIPRRRIVVEVGGHGPTVERHPDSHIGRLLAGWILALLAVGEARQGRRCECGSEQRPAVEGWLLDRHGREFRAARHAATAKSDDPQRSVAPNTNVLHQPIASKMPYTDRRAARNRELDDGNLQSAAGLRIFGKRAAQPRAPSYRRGSAEKAPGYEQQGNRHGYRSERNQRDGKNRHDERDSDQDAEQASSQQPPDPPGIGNTRQTHDEQHGRKRWDGETRHVPQERAQIGEERELPHEEHQDGSHTERDWPAAKQRQHVSGRPPSARRKRRQADPLPDQRQKAERDDEEKAPRHPT